MSRLSISLSEDMIDAVRARVSSGRYADESEVVVEGLRALAEQEQTVETWLRGPVADACDAMDRGEGAFLSADELRASLGIG